MNTLTIIISSFISSIFGISLLSSPLNEAPQKPIVAESITIHDARLEELLVEEINKGELSKEEVERFVAEWSELSGEQQYVLRNAMQTLVLLAISQHIEEGNLQHAQGFANTLIAHDYSIHKKLKTPGENITKVLGDVDNTKATIERVSAKIPSLKERLAAGE